MVLHSRDPKHVPMQPKLSQFNPTLQLPSVRKEYLLLKKRNKAASQIQKSYRYAVKRVEAIERWKLAMATRRDKMVAQMQKIVRGKQARKLFRRNSLIISGKKILAAKTILRAWVNFKISKRFIVLLEESREEFLMKKISRLVYAYKGNSHLKSQTLHSFILHLPQFHPKENEFDLSEVKKDIRILQVPLTIYPHDSSHNSTNEDLFGCTRLRC